MAKSKKSAKEKNLKPAKAEKPPKEKKAKEKPPEAKAEKKAPATKKMKIEAPKPSIAKAPKPVKAPAPEGVVTITIEEVSLRAYFIAERRQAMGWPGDSTSDWVEAERQLTAEAKKKAKS